MRAILTSTLFFTLFLASVIAASFSLKPSSKAVADKREIERGRYLEEEVAKCAECHTPRDAEGQLDHEAWLQGAPIWITPVKPIANWADRAPPFGGTTEPHRARSRAGFTARHRAGSETLRPPMHIYHMNHKDAHAIVAYLRSLSEAVH